jgi:hypothetical protein
MAKGDSDDDRDPVRKKGDGTPRTALKTRGSRRDRDRSSDSVRTLDRRRTLRSDAAHHSRSRRGLSQVSDPEEFEVEVEDSESEADKRSRRMKKSNATSRPEGRKNTSLPSPRTLDDYFKKHPEIKKKMEAALAKEASDESGSSRSGDVGGRKSHHSSYTGHNRRRHRSRSAYRSPSRSRGKPRKGEGSSTKTPKTPREEKKPGRSTLGKLAVPKVTSTPIAV